MLSAPSIALVEDDSSMRKALHRLLASGGFAVRTFASAEEYLAARIEPEPDCLLVDVHLGAHTGFDLVAALRRQGRGATVVFMTAHDGDETRERAASFDAARYLQKPFEADTLFETLQAMLGPDSSR